MSLINLARESAEKRDLEQEQKNKLAHQQDLDLQSRLANLRVTVSLEILQLDQEMCKFGKLVVTSVQGVRLSTIDQLFMYITIPSQYDNPRVLELILGIDVGEHKYSDESAPIPYKDPMIWATVYSPNGSGRWPTLTCTDEKDSTTKFFDELGKQLSVWF